MASLHRGGQVLAARSAFFRINETPGVASLVHVRGQAPLPVPDAVMRALQDRTDPYGEVLRPGPRWRRPRLAGRAGDRVRFAEGNPLFGFYGEIKRVLGAEILVELEAEILGRREARVPLSAIAEVLKV